MFGVYVYACITNLHKFKVKGYLAHQERGEILWGIFWVESNYRRNLRDSQSLVNCGLVTKLVKVFLLLHISPSWREKEKERKRKY